MDVRADLVLRRLQDAGALLGRQIDDSAVVLLEPLDPCRSVRDPLPLNGHAEQVAKDRHFAVDRGSGRALLRAMFFVTLDVESGDPRKTFLSEERHQVKVELAPLPVDALAVTLSESSDVLFSSVVEHQCDFAALRQRQTVFASCRARRFNERLALRPRGAVTLPANNAVDSHAIDHDVDRIDAIAVGDLLHCAKS